MKITQKDRLYIKRTMMPMFFVGVVLVLAVLFAIHQGAAFALAYILSGSTLINDTGLSSDFVSNATVSSLMAISLLLNRHTTLRQLKDYWLMASGKYDCNEKLK